MFLVFCPNVLMFLAFVLWGVSEDNIKTWIEKFSYETEYIVFSAVFYSVLFKSAVDKSLNYAGFEGVMIIILFVIVILFTLFYIIYCKYFFPSRVSEMNVL
ncbi:hypothetical protein cypCar_00049319 [Cyprinus carpio]|nr:hypothetical protein cypCar_00049319 [Cyprinus carpio]